MSNLTEKPITFGEDDGWDKLSPGTNNSGRLVPVDAPMMPLYHYGSSSPKANRITAPDLYPGGIGDPKQIFVFEHLNAKLQAARQALAGNDMDLAVVSGFLSTGNQLSRWRRLNEVRLGSAQRPHPQNEIYAGRYADTAGSAADVVEGDEWGNALEAALADSELSKKLRSGSAFGEMDDAGYRTLVGELLKYRANAGNLPGVEVDPATATSVHNLGCSVNVVPTRNGVPLNVGVGVDLPAWFPHHQEQAVDFFERPIQELITNLDVSIRHDPFLAAYLRSVGVEVLDNTTIEEIRDNRRALHHAMTDAGFGAYKNEVGHHSLSPTGGLPSRAYVAELASEFGYK